MGGNDLMNIQKICLLLFALINAFVLTGCATMTRGTTETVMVQSTPSGADVRVSNGFTGRTPFSFTAPRKGDLVVTISLPGYEAQDHILYSNVAGKGAAGVAGNALIGGVIGIGVDMATGAALSHKPNPLVVTLKPVGIPMTEKIQPVKLDVSSPEPATSPSPTAALPAAKNGSTQDSAGAAGASTGSGIVTPSKP
jgi:hypothetical protein